MSRDREGAVGRDLRVVQAVGLTRSREAAKEDAKVGFRFSVFGQASRGRESAGVRFLRHCGRLAAWMRQKCRRFKVVCPPVVPCALLPVLFSSTSTSTVRQGGLSTSTRRLSQT